MLEDKERGRAAFLGLDKHAPLKLSKALANYKVLRCTAACLQFEYVLRLLKSKFLCSRPTFLQLQKVTNTQNRENETDL